MKINDEDCSVLYTMEIMGKKWNAFIVVELLQEPRLSFSELKRRLNGNYSRDISARVLTDKLNNLEQYGIVVRMDEGGHITYSLTERGEALKMVLEAMKTWAVNFGLVNYKMCRNRSCIHSSLDFIDLKMKTD